MANGLTLPGGAFQAGRGILAGRYFKTSPKNIILVENGVTDVNDYAEFDPLILRQGGILLSHPGWTSTGLRTVVNQSMSSCCRVCIRANGTPANCSDDANAHP
jgi:hypothetical protein